MLFQRKIGLTGGIASGKTTVARHLAALHQLPILDADVYAREAVTPGSAVWQRIVDRYGSDILLNRSPPGGRADAAGTGEGRAGQHPALAPLDRARLGQIVFNNADERHWLEQQIHPEVGDRFDRALADLGDAPTVVLVIPLLFEANLTHRVSETWVVFCTAAQQRDRLMARNGLSVAEAEARIAAQMPLGEKCALADVVLDNSVGLSDIGLGDSQVPAGLLRQVDQALGELP